MAKKKKAASAKSVVEPAKYVIEIGLDSRVESRPDGTYPHLMSLVKVDGWDATKGEPWWFTNFKPGDEIVFRVCDYANLSFGGRIEVKGIVISFLNPQLPRYLSKEVTFNQVTAGVICSGENYFPKYEKDYSSLAMYERPCWHFVDRGQNEVSYFLADAAGIALLRVSVTAIVQTEADIELRCFTHDPEVFIGEGGPPGQPRAKGRSGSRGADSGRRRGH